MLKRYINRFQKKNELKSLKEETTDKAKFSQNGSGTTQLQNLNEEAMLERLIELETLLEEDLKRKAKRQKPKLQAQWQDEIKQLQAKF